MGSLFFSRIILLTCVAKAYAENFSLTTDDVSLRLDEYKMDYMPMNVSHEEYINTMGEYKEMTRNTSQELDLTSLDPSEQQPQANGEILLIFQSPDFINADGITLKMMLEGAYIVKVYQRGETSPEIEVTSKNLDGLPIWVDVTLLGHKEQSLFLRVSCGEGCQVREPKVHILLGIRSGARQGFQREDQTNCEPNKPLEEQRCCLEKVNVKLTELEGLEQVIAPVWYDADYCVGRCEPRYHEKTSHSWLRTKVLSKLERNQLWTCSPAGYKPLYVIRPTNKPEKLQIQVWKKAVALGPCGCY